jgi:hypothetical protein
MNFTVYDDDEISIAVPAMENDNVNVSYSYTISPLPKSGAGRLGGLEDRVLLMHIFIMAVMGYLL